MRFNQYWKHLISTGIQNELPFAEQKRVRLMNALALINFVIPLLYMAFSIVLQLWLIVLLQLAVMIQGLVVLWLNYRRRHNTARMLYLLIAPVIVFFWTLLFGKDLAFENLHLAFMAGTLFMVDKKYYIAALTLLNLTFFVLAKYSYEMHEPAYPHELVGYFYYPNLALGFFMLFIISMLFKMENANYQKEVEAKNEKLEEQKEEILIINEEIQTQHDNLQQMNTQLNLRSEELIKKNKTITNSIQYARRIQSAMLPSLSEMQQYLPNSFIFFMPRDIVSGDFYWFEEKNGKLFFAVVDCTGHGVPGALMSMLGSATLTQIITENTTPEPAQILTELDLRIRKHLRQDEQLDSRDGMDIALCRYDRDTGMLHFAAAQRPVLLLQNGELTEIKGDKNPIGSGAYKQKTFTQHSFALQPGDHLYLFSDGLTDQFGSDNLHKYTSKRLREFVKTMQGYSIDQQHEKFKNEFMSWKGGNTQTDDVLLLGVKI